MRNRWTALAIGAVLVGGCIQYNSQLNIKGASLALTPTINGETYVTQLNQVRYTKDKIDHLLLDIYTVDEDLITETKLATASKDVASGSLDAAIFFGGLTSNQRYRIKAYAYKAPGTDPADLISVDASSTTDVQMPSGGGIATANFKVWLKDTDFDAQTNDIPWNIHEGEIISSDSESVN